MTAHAITHSHFPVPYVACSRCGFELWEPYAVLRVSDAGLYDDARFPGRSLLALREHYTDLLDLPDDVARAYLDDLRDLRVAIRKVTGSDRINYAVLGNAEPHVHWHVIPRNPDREPLPNRSPWSDPRAAARLAANERTRLLEDLASCLQ